VAGGQESRFNHLTSDARDRFSAARCSTREKEIDIPNERFRRRERQAQEFERNQQDLRTSIAESKRLVDEADAMIRRHRDEYDAADSA
jgi:hypothetical protein